MKTYVMMFGIANMIAGGPIYNTNKIRVLEEEGWNVIVFPTNSGKIYMKPLEKYNNRASSFLNYSPYFFGKKKIECILNKMASEIPESSEVIIETGTDFTALWGELLAHKIGARHIVMFLDEKNDKVNASTAPFYEFKYKRNELYSISKESLLHIFGPYFEILNPEKNVWNAWCSNVVADIDSNIKDKLPRADFMIGSIGRLDKPFVDNIIKGVCSFARNNRELNIGMCFFGGADKEVISRIEFEFQKYTNIKLYISGYIWPIPQNIFDMFDVFVSGAGSAIASANMGITTIDIDVYTNNPVGFIDNPTKFHCTQLRDENNSLETYLTAVLLKQNIPEIRDQMTVENKWKIICDDFKKQLLHIEALDSPLEYFDTSTVYDHKRSRKIRFILMHLFGYKQFMLIKKIYNKLRKIE